MRAPTARLTVARQAANLLGPMLRRVSGRGLVGRIASAAVLALMASAIAAGLALADGVRVGSEAEVLSDDGLNLRAKPDYGATVISTVKGGHVVFVMDGPEKGADGPWYQVEYDGDVGWVLGGYLGAARPREVSSRGNAGGRGDGRAGRARPPSAPTPAAASGSARRPRSTPATASTCAPRRRPTPAS